MTSCTLPSFITWRGHVVADERDVDAALLQLPGRQPGALQQRPRFIGEDVEVLALLVGREHRTASAVP